MRTGNIECKHCGIDYLYQFSGSYDATGILKELRDDEYCPDCKSAINHALSQVPRKYEWKYLPTDEITLQELLEIEFKPVASTGLLPIARRIFASLCNEERNEYSKAGEVKHNRKTYHYSYWPSKPDEVIITVKTKVKIENI